MKRLFTAAILAGAAFSMAYAQVVRVFPANAEYNLGYDKDNVVAVSGEFMHWDTVTPQEGGVGEMRFWVRSATGHPVAISVGPQYIGDELGVRFRPNDMVLVTGARVQKPDNGGEIILARQIRTSTRTWDLRSETGVPLWGTGMSREMMATGRSEMARAMPFPDAEYNIPWNQDTVELLKGTFMNWDTLTPNEGGTGEKRFWIRLETGHPVPVSVGPDRWAGEFGIHIRPHEKIEVTASRVNKADGSEVWLAKQIRTSTRTWTVRGERGMPMWPMATPMSTMRDTTRAGEMMYDPMWMKDSTYVRMWKPDKYGTWNGKVETLDRFAVTGSATPGVVAFVRIGNDLVPVHLGPAPFVDKQQYQLHPGDMIVITGSDSMFNNNRTIFANEVRRGNTVWIFRDRDGNPVWVIGR